MSYRKAIRLAATLNFPTSHNKHRLLYHFTVNHPLYKSLQLIKNSPAKPIYSISDIANIWEFKGKSYCHWGTKVRLLETDIPIYNQSGKGWVYFCDLVNLIIED